MKIKKEIILKSTQENSDEILYKLRHPSTDGYCPDPVPKYIEGFIKADIVSIAKQVLQNFPGNTLDENAYKKFITDFMEVFNKLEVSKATVHYMIDYSSSCSSRLKECMYYNWCNMVANDPNTRMSTLMSTIEQSLSKKTMQNYNKNFNEILSILKTDGKELNDVGAIQDRLKGLRKGYQDFMESEQKLCFDTLNECQKVCAPTSVKAEPATNPAQFYQPAPKSGTAVQNKSNTTEAKTENPVKPYVFKGFAAPGLPNW